MGSTTGIAWTDATWNPWYGCSKVSPGCAHCYMFRDMARYGRDAEIVTRSKTKFTYPLRPKFRRDVETAANDASGRRPRIFTCSWSDWFHPGADAWRADAWRVIRETPEYDYQILTKRPEFIRDRLPSDWGDGYPNVWLGVSVENNRWVERADLLVNLPARLRFVSAEPLLGPVTFRLDVLADIDWLIAGGESGPDFREMREDWAVDLRNQCRDAGTAFFLKQLGGWPDARAHDKAVLLGKTYTEFPAVRV